MSNRLATRIGLLAAEDRAPDALDLRPLPRAAGRRRCPDQGQPLPARPGHRRRPGPGPRRREALEPIEHDYYYDLSAGAPGAIGKALAGANRLLYHQRARLGLPRRAGVSIVALVDSRARGARRQARSGGRGHRPRRADVRAAAAALGDRGGSTRPASDAWPTRWARRSRSSHTPGRASWPPATGSRSSPQRGPGRRRRRAASAPWRRCARPRRSSTSTTCSRSAAARGSDGMLAIEIVELAGDGHHPPARAGPSGRAARRPARTTARSRWPMPSGTSCTAPATRSTPASAPLGPRPADGLSTWRSPSCRAAAPHTRASIPRTAVREEGRRRRRGLVGMAAVAGSARGRRSPSPACRTRVRPTPSCGPTSPARRSREALELSRTVEERVDGRDLIDRDPERADELLTDALAAVERAADARRGSAGARPAAGARSTAAWTRIFAVARLRDGASTVADLAAAFTGVDAGRHGAGQRRLAVGGRDRARAGASASTRDRRAARSCIGPARRSATGDRRRAVDDRHRRHGRGAHRPRPAGLALRPRRAGAAPLGAAGPGRRSAASSRLLAALQHRPPLEIFNLYLVDGDERRRAQVDARRRDPGPLPRSARAVPGRGAGPRRRARRATCSSTPTCGSSRRGTVTRVNFGTPRRQEDYSLDPPPDGDVRPDARLPAARRRNHRRAGALLRLRRGQRADPLLPAGRRRLRAPVAGAAPRPGAGDARRGAGAERRLGRRRPAGRLPAHAGRVVRVVLE